MIEQAPPDSPPAPILVVDDRPDSLQAICAVLEPLGQPIVTAGSGDEALRQLLKHPVAVILLDVNMPGLDGFATAALIKQRARTQDIPIIFMTAERDPAERDQIQLGYSSGAVDFLVKPFEPWTLVSKVSVFIELHRTATQLRQQVVELEVSRAALSNAQRIARLAHFTLDTATGEVTWSDGASALFGVAVEVSAGQSPSLPFWPALVGPVDDSATARVEARFERSDGAMISVVGHAEFIRDRTGRVREVRGTLQDVTEHAETKRALASATDALQREHDVTALLQTAMLPTALPGAPGVDMAARYLPAEVGVGGDWYDASLGVDGRLLLAIGDVAGHGLVAATMMNEIRIASRAFAMADPSPARVLQRLKNYGTSSGGPRFVTALIVLLDPVTGEATVASAGHLPPLIVDDDGARFVELHVAPPLGVPSGPPSETTFTLQPGARLVLFTDGLVEQRGSDLDERLAKMAETVASSPDHVEATVDRLVRTLLPVERPADDVAILAIERHADPTLHIELPATPANGAPIRAMVGRWLHARGATDDEIADVALAVGELVSNVAIHAYPMVDGVVVVNLALDGDMATVEVSDAGSWRTPHDRGGGRGLGIVRSVVADVDLVTTAAGTTVRFTRGLDALRSVAS